MRYSRSVLLVPGVLLLAMTLGACHRRTPPPPDEVTRPEELYDAMLARLDGVESARLVATLEYFGDDGRVKLKQVVLVRKPSSLRVETLSPFDSTLNVLTSNGIRLKYFDLQNERFFEGQATAANVAKLVPVYIAPADLVRVVLGGPPVRHTTGEPENWDLSWDSRRGAYSLKIPLEDGGTIEIFVQHRAWTVSGAISRDRNGDVVYEVRSGNFKSVEHGEATMLVPQRIQFLMPARGIDASLDVERYDLNAELGEELFDLSPPAGISVEGL